MRLVFLNQYYPPDLAPTGVVLSDVVEQLAAQGHEVTVLCSAGGYAAGVGMGTQNTEESFARSSSPHSTYTSEAPSSSASLGDLGILAVQNPRIIRIGTTRFGRGSFVGKLADYLFYYVGVARHLLVMRPDRIVALTTPPYLSLLARLISKVRGTDHAHWVMDLYPDVMAAHGMLEKQSLSYQMLAGLARWGYGGKRCAAVVTLGPDMASAVSQSTRHRQESTIHWVPLWGTGDQRSDFLEDGNSRPLSAIPDPCSSISPDALALRRERNWEDDDLVVMYSGNMGLGHRFGEILEAAAGGRAIRAIGGGASSSTIHKSSLRFVFFGGGKRRREVEEFVKAHPDCGVELHDYAPAEILRAHLRSADVHLVSLEPAWTGTMVPSKLQGIFAAGRPVIFIGSADSSIGGWVRDSGGGWVVRPGDVAGLLAVLDEARDPEARASRGSAALAFAREHFDMEKNVARVAEILKSSRCA